MEMARPIVAAHNDAHMGHLKSLYCAQRLPITGPVNVDTAVAIGILVSTNQCCWGVEYGPAFQIAIGMPCSRALYIALILAPPRDKHGLVNAPVRKRQTRIVAKSSERTRGRCRTTTTAVEAENRVLDPIIGISDRGPKTIGPKPRPIKNNDVPAQIHVISLPFIINPSIVPSSANG